MRKNIFSILLILLMLVSYAGLNATVLIADVAEMGAWSISTSSVDNQDWLVATSYYTVDTSAAATDSILRLYTPALAAKFNWNAPIEVIVNESAATINTIASATYLYQGWAETFAVTVDTLGAATITAGYEHGIILDDCKAAAQTVYLYGSQYRVGDTTYGTYHIAPTPEIAFSIESATGKFIAGQVIRIRVVQLLNLNLPGVWHP